MSIFKPFNCNFIGINHKIFTRKFSTIGQKPLVPRNLEHENHIKTIFGHLRLFFLSDFLQLRRRWSIFPLHLGSKSGLGGAGGTGESGGVSEFIPNQRIKELEKIL
jgi:hypothetical protein